MENGNDYDREVLFYGGLEMVTGVLDRVHRGGHTPVGIRTSVLLTEESYEGILKSPQR